MTGTVFNKSDKTGGFTGGSSKFPIHDFTQQFYQINVFPFIFPSYIISFTTNAIMKNQIDCSGMIFNIKPVANLFSISINRNGFT